MPAKKKSAARAAKRAALATVGLSKKRAISADAVVASKNRLEEVEESEFIRVEENAEAVCGGLRSMLKSETWCKCVRCSTAGASERGAIRPAHYAKGGILGLKAGALKELSFHGILTVGLNADAAKKKIVGLTKTGAWLLSASPLQPGASPVDPLPPTPAFDPVMAMRSAAKRPPEPRTREEKEEAAYEAKLLREELPELVNWARIVEDEDELRVYTIALEAIVITQALQAADYRRYAIGRGGVRMLDYREWNNVTVYALGLSDILLGDFLFKGRELSREVDARIRGKKFDGWEGYWPSGFHIDRVRALVTDTAWPTPATPQRTGLPTSRTSQRSSSWRCATSPRRRTLRR